MVLGIGTDITEVNRFESWTTFSFAQLRKIFSEQELFDCSVDGIIRAQKLAVRFAAKEACYKALSAALVKLGYTETTFSFMVACQFIRVVKSLWNLPVLDIDWIAMSKKINRTLPSINAHVSLSDEKTHVVAFVILEV